MNELFSFVCLRKDFKGSSYFTKQDVYPVRKMTTRPKTKVFFVFSFLIENMEKNILTAL